MCIHDIESMLHIYVVHKSLCHTCIPHIVFYIYFGLLYVWCEYVWHRIHIVCTCMLVFYTYMYVYKKFQEAYINISMKVYVLHTCRCMWMLSTNLVRPLSSMRVRWTTGASSTRMSCPSLTRPRLRLATSDRTTSSWMEGNQDLDWQPQTGQQATEWKVTKI